MPSVPIASTSAVRTSGATVVVVQGAAAEQPAPVVDQRVTSRVPEMMRMHAPPLHTRSGPHVAPSFAGVAPFSQTWVPVAQEVTPATQTFGFVTHAAFATQPTQLPALHTRSVPHEVPFAFAVGELSQVRAPVAQDSMPSMHGFGFVEHAPPAAQATHAPASQTWFVPQLVPSAICAAVSRHCCVPVEQELVPTRHRLGFVVQAAPAVQAEQTPPLHTWFVPQTVPFVSWVEVCTQAWVPVEQEVCETRHAPAGVQSAPATQGEQVPALQTRFVPQDVPFATGLAVSTQVDVPVAQDVVPATHGFGLSEQGTSAVQAAHVPPLQTWPTPQVVPFGRLVAVFTQVCVPVEQDVVPALQGSGFVVQA